MRKPTVASSAKGDEGLSVDHVSCTCKTSRWLAPSILNVPYSVQMAGPDPQSRSRYRGFPIHPDAWDNAPHRRWHSS